MDTDLNRSHILGFVGGALTGTRERQNPTGHTLCDAVYTKTGHLKDTIRWVDVRGEFYRKGWYNCCQWTVPLKRTVSEEPLDLMRRVVFDSLRRVKYKTKSVTICFSSSAAASHLPPSLFLLPDTSATLRNPLLRALLDTKECSSWSLDYVTACITSETTSAAPCAL